MRTNDSPVNHSYHTSVCVKAGDKSWTNSAFSIQKHSPATFHQAWIVRIYEESERLTLESSFITHHTVWYFRKKPSCFLICSSLNLAFFVCRMCKLNRFLLMTSSPFLLMHTGGPDSLLPAGFIHSSFPFASVLVFSDLYQAAANETQHFQGCDFPHLQWRNPFSSIGCRGRVELTINKGLTHRWLDK